MTKDGVSFLCGVEDEEAVVAAAGPRCDCRCRRRVEERRVRRAARLLEPPRRLSGSNAAADERSQSLWADEERDELEKSWAAAVVAIGWMG